MSEDSLTALKRFQVAVDLHRAGVAVVRQNLRRKYPDASDAEIDRRLGIWLRTRPGAEYGDVTVEGHRRRTRDRD